MVKRSRSVFESITFIADGREYNIQHLVDWNTSQLQSLYNPEQFEYGISLRCLDVDMWVRCKNEAEQLSIITTLSNI